MVILNRSDKLFARCFVYLKKLVGPDGQALGPLGPEEHALRALGPEGQAPGVAQKK